MREHPVQTGGPPERSGTARSSVVLVLLVILAALGFALRQLVRHGDRAAAPGARQMADDEDVATPYVQEFALFGTYGRISFWCPPATAQRAVTRILAELQRIHDTLNIFSETSELSHLNRTAAAAPVRCSPRLWDVLLEARRAYWETDGAVDVTVAPLMQVQGFHRRRSTRPSRAEIDAALAAVGLDKVIFDDAEDTVRFTHPQAGLDMGAIAKGLALDHAAAIARTCGIRQGLIDLGGNIYCLELPPPGKSAYTIGIRNPFDRDALFGTISVINGAVATSGNYEQFVELEGEIVSHIMNPRTGQPVAHVSAVTVVTARGVDSDIYSTGIFVAGAALVKPFLERHPDARVLQIFPGSQGRATFRAYNWEWQPGSAPITAVPQFEQR